MPKVKEVIINENHTLKNYFILDDGTKVNMGDSHTHIINKFFDGYAAKFQDVFPNIQHTVFGLNFNGVYPSHVYQSNGVALDTAPFYDAIRDFQKNSVVQVDNNAHKVLITFEGVTGTFDFA